LIKAHGIVRAAANRVAQAAERTVQALSDDRIEQEPAFTDRMLGHIEEAMNGFVTKGIKWEAKTLTDRAPGAQETRHGADFIGVLHVSLPDYTVKKGFLAQAKLVKPGAQFPLRDWRNLQDQCAKMLALSPDSYVFIYSTLGIHVIPATSIRAARHWAGQPHDFYSRTVQRFFEEHFESFIGDARISAPSIEALERLRQEFQTRRLLYLEASLA